MPRTKPSSKQAASKQQASNKPSLCSSYQTRLTNIRPGLGAAAFLSFSSPLSAATTTSTRSPQKQTLRTLMACAYCAADELSPPKRSVAAAYYQLQHWHQHRQHRQHQQGAARSSSRNEHCLAAGGLWWRERERAKRTSSAGLGARNKGGPPAEMGREKRKESQKQAGP